MSTNKQVLLTSRPTGWVTEDNFKIVSTPVPKSADGQILVRNHYLSLDPYMRGRMNDTKSYAPKQEIDEVIRQKAPAWPLEQVAVVDRNILRLAIYEILIDNRVPVRAAINEAVELAKSFGGESSPKFVNGVLGSVSLMRTG